MPWPGFEPGLSRPQREVLTTIRSRPEIPLLCRQFERCIFRQLAFWWNWQSSIDRPPFSCLPITFSFPIFLTHACQVSLFCVLFFYCWYCCSCFFQFSFIPLMTVCKRCRCRLCKNFLVQVIRESNLKDRAMCVNTVRAIVSHALCNTFKKSPVLKQRPTWGSNPRPWD